MLNFGGVAAAPWKLKTNESPLKIDGWARLGSMKYPANNGPFSWDIRLVRWLQVVQTQVATLKNKTNNACMLHRVSSLCLYQQQRRWPQQQ